MPPARVALAAPLCLTLVMGAAAVPLAAQESFDRGVFALTHENAEVGREEFAIRSGTTRGGPGFLAVSTLRTEGREVQCALEVARDYVPVSFQQTTTAGGRVVSRISAQLSGIRFSARVASQDGETAREFPVRPPVVILADDAFSEFYFLPRPDSGQRALAVVRPGEPRAESGQVVALGPDTVNVAGQRVPARRYALRVGSNERQFWFTPSGDLLQVSVPGRGIVATRAELPHR